jgi:hypothetical protein
MHSAHGAGRSSFVATQRPQGVIRGLTRPGARVSSHHNKSPSPQPENDLAARIASGEFTDAGSTKEKLTKPVRQALAKLPGGERRVLGLTVLVNSCGQHRSHPGVPPQVPIVRRSAKDTFLGLLHV